MEREPFSTEYLGGFFLATKGRGKFLISKNQSESERYYLNKFLVCFFDSFDRQIKTKNK